MNAFRARAIPTVLIILLLTACGGGGGKSGTSEFGLIDWPSESTLDTGPEIGNRAPNFRLQTPDGATIELATFAGKPVLLNFFASWCANCKEEMRDLDAAYKGGVAVIGVDYRESAETVSKLASETGATFPMTLDPKTEVSRDGYRVTNLPVTVLIDGSGVIREIVRGPVDSEHIDELIKSVESAPPEARTA